MIPAILLALVFLLFFRGADLSLPYPPLKKPAFTRDAPDPRGYRQGFRPEPARKKAAKRIQAEKSQAKGFGAPPVLHPRIVFMESPSNWFN